MTARHAKAKPRPSCSEFHRAIEAAEAGGNAPLGFGLSNQQTTAVNKYLVTLCGRSSILAR
jgi:hypothetical protein